MKYCVAKFDTERVMWLYFAKEGYGYCWTSKSNDKNIVLFSKEEAETFCKEEVKKHCKKGSKIIITEADNQLI